VFLYLLTKVSNSFISTFRNSYEMNAVDMENVRPASAKELSNNSRASSAGSNLDDEALITHVAVKDGESLQDAFAKFREQKKSERRLQKACRVPGNRSEEFKDQLRGKFIEQAHKYLGIPYHERYREEGTEVGPLYLDCCGLVRKSVQDLKEDFGFLMGRWNQAYQMDTLPIVLTPEQLKPGDLIFYEGTFTSKRSKVQKHNNVHVEIFLGGETGEATIGARYQKGVVQVFPSYKFVSKSWDLISYHYRSLDTWLDGLCVSHCSEHPWVSESGSLYAAAGRKSIFNDEEDDDVDAGDYGEDEEETESPLDDSTAVASVCNESLDGLSPVHCCAAAVSEGGSPAAAGVAADSGAGFDSLDASPDLAADVPPGAAFSTKKAAQPRPKRSALVAVAAAPGADGAIKPRGSASPTRIAPNTSGGGKIPPRSRKVVTVGASSSEDLLAIDGSVAASSASLSRAAQKEKKEMMEGRPLPKTYFVGKSNGWKLVCAALDKRGWQQIPFEYNMSTRFTLKWVERRSQIDYKAHVAGQMVNHIINNDVFTTKLGLVNCLRDFFCRTFNLPSTAAAPAPTPTKTGVKPGDKKPAGAGPGTESKAGGGKISFDDMILGTAPRLPTPWMMETYQLDQVMEGVLS
jgi:hypothetical protein